MRALVALCLLVGLAGCSWQRTASNLLSITAIGPNRIDAGDRIELLGDGFPEGRTAKLTFRGSLFRPGQPPRQDVDIVVPAEGSSMRRLTAAITEDVQAQFCGAGNQATSTTFRGYVVAAFAPRSAGAPPITGMLDGVVLEIVASDPNTATSRERSAAAQRALAQAGITVSQDDPGRLVVAKSVGIAARAGLLVGDELLELDGVRLTRAQDFIPPGDSARVKLVVARTNVDVPFELLLQSDAFRHAATSDVAMGALLLLLACGTLLLFSGPLPVAAAWVLRSMRLRSIVKGRHGAGGRTGPTPALAALVRPLWDMPLLLRLAPHACFIAILAMWTSLSFGAEILAAGLDSTVILACANICALLAAVILGGLWLERRWSLSKGLLASLHAMICQAPAILSLGAALSLVGSLRLADVVSTQGGLPQDWLLFRSPGTWVAFGLFFLSSLPQAARTTLPISEGIQPRSPRKPGRLSAAAAAATLANWVQLWLLAGLGSTVFLGGWAVPDFAQIGGVGELLLGAIILQSKIWLLALAIVLARWVLYDIQYRDVLTMSWKVWTPLAIVCLLANLAWVRGLHWELLQAAQPWLSAALAALTVTCSAWIIRQLWVVLKSPHLHGQINPWL